MKVFRSRLGKALLAAVMLGTGTFAGVASLEGLRTVAYLDPTGTPTVCYGETLAVALGDVYSVAECRDMLAERLPEFERGMVVCIEEPDKVPDTSYIAFLSFTYNVGVGAFCKSTLVRKLNAGDLPGACNELPRWNKSKGKVLPGLVKRRAQEQELCLSGQNIAQGEGAPWSLFIIFGAAAVVGVILLSSLRKKPNA